MLAFDSSCNTSPSAILLVVSAMISMILTVTDLHQNLEGAGVDEIAYQHAGRVVPLGINRGAATAQCGHVHHVIVEQSRGVNKLHHGGHGDVLFIPDVAAAGG